MCHNRCMKPKKSVAQTPEIAHVLEDFSNFRRVLLVQNGKRIQAMQSKRKSWNSKLARLADPKIVKMVFDAEGLLMLIPLEQDSAVIPEEESKAVPNELSGVHEMFSAISELENLEDALIPKFLRAKPTSEQPTLDIRWKVIIPVAIICLTAPGIIVELFSSLNN